MSQILSDEIVSLRNRRRDLSYKITFGRRIAISNVLEFLSWTRNKYLEIASFCLNVLMF
jgi:hypothetical protein